MHQSHARSGVVSTSTSPSSASGRPAYASSSESCSRRCSHSSSIRSCSSTSLVGTSTVTGWAPPASAASPAPAASRPGRPPPDRRDRRRRRRSPGRRPRATAPGRRRWIAGPRTSPRRSWTRPSCPWSTSSIPVRRVDSRVPALPVRRTHDRRGHPVAGPDRPPSCRRGGVQPSAFGRWPRRRPPG